MLINNINAEETYGLILNEKKISPCKTENNLVWNRQSLSPILLSQETKFCNIECKFTIKAESEEKFTDVFSRFCKETQDCILKFNNINANYKCWVDSASNSEQITNNFWEFTVNWIGYKYKDLITIEINEKLEQTVHNLGNLPTPCVLEITPTINLIDFIVEGFTQNPIKIKNLTKGKVTILDGEQCTVTENGINKFADTELWEFPKLQTGNNIITFSKDNCKVKLLYKSRCI